jgi:hypothetical protein
MSPAFAAYTEVLEPTRPLRIAGIPPGSYTSTIAAPGYDVIYPKFRVSAGQTIKLRQTMKPGAKFRWFVGHKSGAPEKGAVCRLTPKDSKHGDNAQVFLTDQYGDIWASVSAGTYQAEVRVAGLAVETLEITIIGGQDFTHRTLLD